ncbi:MAG: NIPSNAP family protein [Bacteroidetes bacterium]|nr:NIPSNAP family protein [Bacteroidota bacterium]
MNRILLFAILLLPFCSNATGKKPKQEYYKLVLYHYSSINQEQRLDNYFQNALLPALHRAHINEVGVFKSIANDTAIIKSMYLWVPLASLQMIEEINKELDEDTAYQRAASDYINTDHANPVYDRMETILLKAFPLKPHFEIPQLQADKKDRVYELRSYEGASEKLFRNKVKMFNEGGEIGLFKRLNFQSLFYSEVIAGSHMPNLMYMTCYENQADRDAHWKTFSADAFWKQLSSSPEYQNNVSHIDIVFLHPAAYSDL